MGKGEGIALGVVLGVALGAALDNVGVGIALGVAIGAALDAAARAGWGGENSGSRGGEAANPEKTLYPVRTTPDREG